MKVIIKLKSVLDESKEDIVGFTNVPDFSTTTLTLDRDSMGKVFLAESESETDDSWRIDIHTMEAMLNVLSDQMAKLSFHMNALNVAVQKVKMKVDK